VLGSDALTVPGSYAIQARAVDVAGNTSAWGLPVDVIVPPGGSPGGSGPTGPSVHVSHITVDGRMPDASGSVGLLKTWGARVRVTASLADGLGSPARHVHVEITDGHGRLASGTTNAMGRIALDIRVSRSGTALLSADGGPALATITLRMRPLVTLDRAERHAQAGRPLTLGSNRTLTITGEAAPRSIVVGQPVELEYRVGHAWLPLGLPGIVSRTGHWRVSYSVARPGSARVEMRVLLPSQPGLPFAPGASTPFAVAIH